MKYRLLNAEELAVLEEDLKAFLIVNGVDGSIWAEINQNRPEQALQLVELFSDTVLQKVYEKIQYLEHRSKNSCLVFRLNENEMDMLSLNLTTDNHLSLETPESIHFVLQNDLDALQIFKSQKKYSETRELAIHEMLTQGCVPSSSDFWISLENAFLA